MDLTTTLPNVAEPETLSPAEEDRLAKALKPIYQALNAEAAEQALLAFETGPGGKQYPTVVATWKRAGIESFHFSCFPIRYGK